MPSRVLIVLSTLVAEGTPVMALGMCRRWLQRGIKPVVATLLEGPDGLRPEFRELGVPIHQYRLPSRGLARFGALAAETHRLARELRPDAVLSMPLGWHSFIALGAKLAGVRRVVAHVGNYPPHWDGLAYEKFRWEVRVGEPVTDRLVCCSEYVQQGVVEHFRIPREKTAVVLNGVSTARFADCAQRSRAEGTPPRPVIGMVARLEVHKDQPTLIQAARLLKDRGVNCEVWLVGEGSRRRELEHLVEDLGVKDQVRLLGTRRDVPELLGKMSVFVFSAKRDEGLGIALIEAMAAGVPVVATDVGACREVLDGGNLGELVPERSPEAMAAAVERLLAQPARASGQVAAARAKASAAFSEEAMADAYAALIGVGP